MDKNSPLIDLSESDQTDHGRVAFLDQSLEQRVFSAIWALESQVNSGGFPSFLEYEEPDLVAFSPLALQIIGAATCASIVGRAVALAHSGDPDELSNEFDELDSEFYSYPDDLTELLFGYVVANELTFGKIPGVA